MLREVQSLGFEWVELSHGIRISLVPGILRAIESGVVKVSSVHNFCPLPTGYTAPAPNIYMPSADDRRECDQWLRQTRRTIDFAKQVGARVVVLHLGAVEFFWFNPVNKFRRHVEGQAESFSSDAPKYVELRNKTMERIRKRQSSYYERMRAYLELILPYAEEKGVRLGLENRERVEELPLDDAMPGLIAGLSRPGVAGYWHDTGHAQIKQRLGLINHERQLAENAGSTLGFHLHDIDATGKDHQPVGSGVIDFGMVSRFIRPEHVCVLEYSPRVTPEAVMASRNSVGLLFPG
jgi:sugar phosphate isomerase/epimerase